MTHTPSPGQHSSGVQIARHFLLELHAGLPSSYKLANGKIYLTKRQGMPTNTPVCSPLRVTALIRDPNGQGWARLVEVLTPDMRVNECVVPHAELEAKPLEAIARLADCGMQIHGQREELFAYLKSWKVRTYALRLDKVGWSRGHTAFAMADGRIIAPPRSDETLIYTGPVNRFSAGSLEGWRSGIAALAAGNPYLIFGISLAFSGPLLALTQQSSGIFHLHGATSIGKTKILQAALSVWPRAEKEFSWTSTSAGLEGLLAETNDMFLGLDELPRNPHTGFGDDIYTAVNGSGKNRATVTGQAQTRQQWRVPILSTGETPVRQLLRDQGQSLRGGQGVRMIDVPVTGMAHGGFDKLHGCASSRDFARKIEQLAPRDSGHAGATFIGRLIAGGQEREVQTQADILHGEHLTKLLDHLGLDADTAGNETLRVLDRFALIATAGRFASQMGITGWPLEAALNAVARIAAAWYEDRGADVPTDRTSAVEITRDYLQRYGDSRFALLPNSKADALQAPATRSHEASGYRDEEYFYIFKAGFDEMHRGHNSKNAATHLQAAGYLEPGKERSSLQYRLSGLGTDQRPRVYRIRTDILGA